MVKDSKRTVVQGNIDNFHIDLPSLKYWGDDAWRVDAECKGYDTNLFFPTQSIENNKGLSSNVSVSKARLICAGCTVRKECLNFAFENSITLGMFGGRTPKERRLNTLKVNDGSLSFKMIVRDLKSVRRRETKEHPQAFVDELASILKRDVSEVIEMYDSGTDTQLY